MCLRVCISPSYPVVNVSCDQFYLSFAPSVVATMSVLVSEAAATFFYCLGEVVAQLKYTILLMPNGPMKITGGPKLDLSCFETENKVEDEELKVSDAFSRKICSVH